jgi:hypothetical protein
MDIETLDGAGRHEITQALEPWAYEGSSTIVLIEKLHGVGQREAIGHDALAEGGDLAGNGGRFGARLRGDAGIDRNGRRTH